MQPPTVQGDGEPGRRFRPLGLLALGLVVALIGGLIVSIALNKGGPRGANVQLSARGATATLYSGLDQRGARLGDAGAPVELLLFTDVQCRKCAIYQRRVVDRVIERYVRPGRVSIELRHFSTSARERTVGAIASAAAAGQDREWQFAELLLANQDRAPNRQLGEGFLENLASAAGLDIRQWKRDRDSSKVTRTLDEDAREALERRIPAEPAVVVQGPGGSVQLDSSPTAGRIGKTIRAVR